jgi:hypothetical protein
MMATTYSFLTLILCLLNGGGNDLLDYLPTEPFWKEKQVAVSVERMVKELAEHAGEDVKPLIEDLGSPDAETRDKAALRIREIGGAGSIAPLAEAAESPDAEVRRRARTLLRQIGGDQIERGVRRLMAIRTLGEIGKPEAVPALKPLLESKELFVADYARVAIDTIEGRQPSAARLAAPSLADDVWLLPDECQTVGQLVPRRAGALGFAEFMAAVQDDEEAKRDESAAMVTRLVLSLAEKIGNVRIDAATFGISGTLVRVKGQRDGAGYLAIVVRGKYHADWLRSLAKSEKVPVEDVGGVEVFQPDGESAWLMPSDELFVYVASDDAVDAPAKALAAAVKSGKPGSASGASDEATAKLMAGVDTKQVLWAVSRVTEPQKALPVAAAFDTMNLVGTREGRTLTLKLAARGSDPKEVEAAVARVNKHAKESAEFLEGMQVASVIRMAVELLKSMHAEADGTSATLTAKLNTTPAAILSLPVLYDEDPDAPEEVPAHPRLRSSR